MKMRLSYFVFIPALLLKGCFINPGVDEELRDLVQKGEQGPANLSSLPKVPPEAVISHQPYQGISFRSPFDVQAFAESALLSNQIDGLENQASNIKRVDPRRPSGYIPETLESVELSALKMVGVLRASTGTKFIALVTDSDGTIHQVDEGDYMGMQVGHVIKITEQYIELEEVEFSSATDWKLKQVFVQLETVPL